MDDDKFTALVRNAASELLATPAMEKLVKETVLLTLNEVQRRREQSVAEAFLTHCERQGVTLGLDEAGRPVITGGKSLDAGMRAALVVYRDPIVEELVRRHLRAAAPQTLPFKAKPAAG
jgi:hypothetical protein